MVIDDGKIALQGTPREVFSNVEQIKKLKLDMPQIMELSYELYKCGKFGRYDILTIDEFVKEIEKISNSQNDKDIADKEDAKDKEDSKDKEDAKDTEDTEDTRNKSIEPILSLKNVSLKYEENTSMEVKALDDISLDIYNDEFIGIIGHTGSGKSSLVQVMNGLIKANGGEVTYKGENIQDKSFDKKRLHLDVGLVFQYPESQLFEETVLKDVMFGPLNKGMSEEEAKNAAKEALEMLGIGENYYNDSPLNCQVVRKEESPSQAYLQ